MRRVKQGADVPQNTSQPLLVPLPATVKLGDLCGGRYAGGKCNDMYDPLPRVMSRGSGVSSGAVLQQTSQQAGIRRGRATHLRPAKGA